jgi:hypothetical protein
VQGSSAHTTQNTEARARFRQAGRMLGKAARPPPHIVVSQSVQTVSNCELPAAHVCVRCLHVVPATPYTLTSIVEVWHWHLWTDDGHAHEVVRLKSLEDRFLVVLRSPTTPKHTDTHRV